ncbi:MAG: acyl-CoA dehydrogenase family protein [Myxococcota bacterium]|nr:acyl-CoA dehydrogenase family protein [Myxococcota bacterium]
MYIGLNEEQQALRRELRAYYAGLLTDEIREALHREAGCGPVHRQVIRQMGKDGWLGIGWPTEYGGQGRSQLEQFVFFDESMRCGAPVPMLTINTVGPTLYTHASDDLKAELLPKITAGEILFCVGYTESAAGTDLASLSTRADRDGDDYVINGQKIFTSVAGDADYIWLAARTDQEAAKHAGLSMFVVDMKTPGIKVEPMRLLSHHDINTTFFDDVRVPAKSLVGGENKGWKLITSQLNHERVTLCSSGMIEGTFENVLRWTRETKRADGIRVIDQEWVQTNLARVWSGIEFLRLMNWKVAWDATQGDLAVQDASALKVFGTEFYMEAIRLMMEVIGPRAYLPRESPEAVLHGQLANIYCSLLILTFGGGTNEVQRDLIGLFGLGLPRVPRM